MSRLFSSPLAHPFKSQLILSDLDLCGLSLRKPAQVASFLGSYLHPRLHSPGFLRLFAWSLPSVALPIWLWLWFPVPYLPPISAVTATPAPLLFPNLSTFSRFIRLQFCTSFSPQLAQLHQTICMGDLWSPPYFEPPYHLFSYSFAFTGHPVLKFYLEWPSSGLLQEFSIQLPISSTPLIGFSSIAPWSNPPKLYLPFSNPVEPHTIAIIELIPFSISFVVQYCCHNGTIFHLHSCFLLQLQLHW